MRVAGRSSGDTGRSVGMLGVTIGNASSSCLASAGCCEAATLVLACGAVDGSSAANGSTVGAGEEPFGCSSLNRNSSIYEVKGRAVISSDGWVDEAGVCCECVGEEVSSPLCAASVSGGGEACDSSRRSHERRHVLIVCFLLSRTSPVSIGTDRSAGARKRSYLAMKPVRICVTFTHTIRIDVAAYPCSLMLRSRALCADD